MQITFVIYSAYDQAIGTTFGVHDVQSDFYKNIAFVSNGDLVVVT